VSSRNRLRLLSAGAVQTLTPATTYGQPAVRAGALHALALLILPNDASASAAADDGVDVHAVNAAAATRSHIDALVPALLSAASSGELLILAAIPLLHYVVVILDAVKHFVMKLVIIIQQQQQQQSPATTNTTNTTNTIISTKKLSIFITPNSRIFTFFLAVAVSPFSATPLFSANQLRRCPAFTF
jgi:hypothetical protein